KKDGDTQAMFVLPEARLRNDVRPQVDSPANNLMYHVNWSNVSDQVQTVKDALAVAHVEQSAVTDRVVSAHSGGGSALNNAINADESGARLQADRLMLYDCMYHFKTNKQIGEKVVNGKTIPIYETPEEWQTDKRLESWSDKPNGQKVREVVFFSAG